MSLAIKYRPSTFDEIIGNELTVQSLQVILSRDLDRIQHAFLFNGPSGCGKTTLARIVANELGCSEQDYYEIDSADFRGIDTIREIRKQMMYAPVAGKVRVWLIDECHQLSKDAQNALLKALEDAPKHVYFLLATTDPEKLLATIRGRCATFGVQALDEEDIVLLLKHVAGKERKRVPADVLKQIAQDCMGSSRNALQVLDKIIDMPPSAMRDAAEKTAAQENQVIDLCRALMKLEKWEKVASILKGLEKEDAEKIRLAVMGYCKSILLSGKDAPAAALIMSYFKDPLWNNGWAGLVLNAYEALEGGK